jgi:hypothetical protein
MHVVVAHYNEDLSWVTNLKCPFTVISRNGLPKDTASNKGNEASIFLEYIVKNYDTLSDYTFFVHGHRSSWHHAEPMDEKVNRTVCDLPYFNVNDIPPFLIKACPRTTDQILRMYPPIEHLLGPLDMDRITFRMGAQFYVHRNAIRSRPREIYAKLYEFIMNNTGQSFEDGLLFERIWHFIFTNDVVDR